MSEETPDIVNQDFEQPAEGAPRWVRTPPIDIFETDEGLVLRADLPGVDVDGLELQVQDNRLTLLGRVNSPAPENALLIHQEYHEGDFLRSFILSDDVDHERISAKLSQGVLEVLLPRTPRTEPRKISVKVQ
ncbi:Hsp20/alpha crystallin family protein [Planctomicrobium sp. SH668]|uniref:Hsp20/alpha crystallin family protein n=1 Tax=Planctomicrobium sp. SH668 TaxID=3448126 RepID=UPI003F5C0EBC